MTAIFKWFVKFALVAGLFAGGFAMAQSEPSMGQIYATAQAGKLDEAQVMVQQVLISHPKSAKAHFVQAELFARQGKLDLARQSLVLAEQYAPGLPFAKADAVQALKTQLATPAQRHATSSYAVPPGTTQSSGGWVLPLLLTGGFITAAYFIFRKRESVPVAQPSYGTFGQNGLTGPQTFGSNAGMPATYPSVGYSQSTYPQPAGTGMGGRIMGGVATGLAVGAGVMAAEAIGRTLLGSHNNNVPQAGVYGGSNTFEPIVNDVNQNMGGTNFGISDTTWDDGGGSGSSDWDN